MPSLASDPTHRLHLCWEKHCKLLPEVSGLTAKHVAKWTVEEVSYLFPVLLSWGAGMAEPSSSGVLIGSIFIFFLSYAFLFALHYAVADSARSYTQVPL